jgi:O-succinylbenzoic acid--CoA ligase
VPRLVAVDAVLEPAFVAALQRAWHDGDAVLPVDPRLPGPARGALLAAMRVGESVAEGDALVVPTSGSTGPPKAVVLTHAAVRASAEASSARLAVDPGADRWLACLPLAHVGGLSVVTRALLTGTGLTFDPADAGATLVSLVPTQVDRMDVSRFRAVLVGGGADWRDRPPNVVRTYGLTEAGSGVAYDGVPLDGVEVRIVGGGHIHLRGPMLLRCYRDGTDPKDANGWLPTGDLGELTDDGRLVVHGRAAEVIVTGGEKVWPQPVEERLRAHPAVADAAVAGRADPEWGQRVVAYVVPADPSAPPALDTLRGWVKEVLPPWCAPRQVVVVEALPRTALGKLRRAALPST